MFHKQKHIASSGSITASLIAAAAVVLFLLPTPKPGQAAAAAAPNPTAAPTGTVMLGDFEGQATQDKQYGTLVLRHGDEFGWGWSTTSDRRMGGHSSASIAIVHPGAGGTHGALRVSGEIKAGFIEPWAGAIWFPGSYPTQPADLSASKELSFRARGTPGSYNLMLSTGSAESMPIYHAFVIGKQWKEYHIPLAASFPNADWKKVVFLAFTAANSGKFQFELDQVSLH